MRGKKDLRGCFYDPPWQLLGWRLGSKDCCCGWPLLGSQECSAPSPSRALCCRLCLTFKGQKKQAWKEVARHPPLFAGPVGPARAGRRPRMSGCAGCRRPAGPCPSAAALGRWPAPVQRRQRRLNSCAGRRRPLRIGSRADRRMGGGVALHGSRAVRTADGCPAPLDNPLPPCIPSLVPFQAFPPSPNPPRSQPCRLSLALPSAMHASRQRAGAYARTPAPTDPLPHALPSHGMFCTPPTMGYSRTRTSPRAGGALLLADLAQ